jgi:hypothetical protein
LTWTAEIYYIGTERVLTAETQIIQAMVPQVLPQFLLSRGQVVAQFLGVLENFCGGAFVRHAELSPMVGWDEEMMV